MHLDALLDSRLAARVAETYIKVEFVKRKPHLLIDRLQSTAAMLHEKEDERNKEETDGNQFIGSPMPCAEASLSAGTRDE